MTDATVIADADACSPATAHAIGTEAATTVAGALKALADPLRLRMLSAIATDPRGESCVCDLAELAEYAMEFCALESCGKCTPCRIGSTRGVEVIARIRQGDTSGKQVTLLRDLCDTMVAGSLCAMGGMTPYPVISALNYFPEDFGLEPATQPTAPAAAA